MAEFRYAQFCPLARAAEIVGERWTLLVLRELFCGPQRFSDLRRRLPGISSSVLSERLQRLEERGVVRRGELPPPAASSVYELAEAGLALERPLVELMRWGLRWLEPVPGDHLEPDWAALGLRLFARRGPTRRRRYALRVLPQEDGAGTPVRVFVRGGPDGTRVDREPGPVDLELEAPALLTLGIATGRASARELVAAGLARADGDLAALDDLPGLFDFGLEAAPGRSGSPTP